MADSRHDLDTVLAMEGALATACGYECVPLNYPTDGEPKVSRPTITTDGKVHRFVCEAVLAESTPEYHRVVITARETTGGQAGDTATREVRVFADGHWEF